MSRDIFFVTAVEVVGTIGRLCQVGREIFSMEWDISVAPQVEPANEPKVGPCSNSENIAEISLIAAVNA